MNTGQCSELTSSVLSAMNEDGYTESTTQGKYLHIFNNLNNFCARFHQGRYTPEIGAEFLLTIAKKNPPYSEQWKRLYNFAIQKLNHAIDGNLHWFYTSVREYTHSRFDYLIGQYDEYLALNNRKTMKNRRTQVHVISRFLQYIDSAGLTSLRDMNASILYQSFLDVKTSKSNYASFLKAFLQYLYKYEFTDYDLSCYVPSVPRHKAIPQIYSLDEVNCILASVDRSTAKGKRDYCVILLIARYGLRPCDVANLKFANLSLEKNIIQLVQIKTGEPVEFPLVAEIRNALEDYLENGRPNTDSQHIFMAVDPPKDRAMSSEAVKSLVSRIIRSSPVDTAGRETGPRALRASFATQLLEEGTPFHVIGKALGHSDQAEVKHYVRVDIEKLRQCALEVPDFHSDALKSYIGGQKL